VLAIEIWSAESNVTFHVDVPSPNERFFFPVEANKPESDVNVYALPEVPNVNTSVPSPSLVISVLSSENVDSTWVKYVDEEPPQVLLYALAAITYLFPSTNCEEDVTKLQVSELESLSPLDEPE